MSKKETIECWLKKEALKFTGKELHNIKQHAFQSEAAFCKILDREYKPKKKKKETGGNESNILRRNIRMQRKQGRVVNA